MLEGVCNFRDLGGIRNKDARTVKRGMIFRCDELSRLTDADLLCLANIPLRTIVDLRTEWEIHRRPDRKPASLRTMAVCTLDTPRCLTSISDLHDDRSLLHVDPNVRTMLGDTDAKLGTMPEERIRATVIKLYETMTSEPDFIEVYRKIFTMLFRDDDVPILFHCMAGKDRTGVVAALILSALDVDEDTIMEDYLVSNVVAEKRYDKPLKINPSLKYLYKAYPEFLRAFLDQIRNDYGTVSRYLREVIGIDPKAMQDRYLI